jgi:hypothetical protein
MGFEKFKNEDEYYAFIGSCGSTIPGSRLSPRTRKAQQQEQDLSSQALEQPRVDELKKTDRTIYGINL